MKKFFAFLIAVLLVFSALPALAEEVEPPLAQLYDPQKFVETFEQAQKDGLIPAAYVMEKEDLSPMKRTSGYIAEYKISDPGIAQNNTFLYVYFQRYTEMDMMMGGYLYPHAASYYVTCTDSKTDEEGEWNRLTAACGTVLNLLTGDESIKDWMQTEAKEYYNLFKQAGGMTKFREEYKGDGYRVSMRNNIQFSFSFSISPE